MLDVIFALKFVHVLAAAAMFGVWLCLATFMLLGHRSGNPSVVAVTTQFVVTVEKMVMIAAIALQPISGLPLAWAIGLSFGEFWIVWSLAIYAVAVACWLAAFFGKMLFGRRRRRVAVGGVPLPEIYRPFFKLWPALAAAVFIFTTATLALMVWQPRF